MALKPSHSDLIKKTVFFQSLSSKRYTSRFIPEKLKKKKKKIQHEIKAKKEKEKWTNNNRLLPSSKRHNLASIQEETNMVPSGIWFTGYNIYIQNKSNET